MNRVPLSLRPAALLAVLALMAASPAHPYRPTADVTGVSILSSPNRAELVIDVRGVVEVSDFSLAATTALPPRLVIDLVGARLVAPIMQYDGVNRGGIRNIRYAQFRPDVVRVVVELDSVRDYEVRKEDAAVRVGFQGASAFEAWSTDGPRGGSRPAVPAPTASAELVFTPPAAANLPPATPVRVAPSAAPVAAAPRVPLFQATSQQPSITVTFDHASIQEVVATFAAFSGRSIVLGAGITGEVTAEIRNQPWDLALNAILDGQGLAITELPGAILRVATRAAILAADSSEPTTTKIYPINYARVGTLQPAVQGIMSARGKAVADTVTNSIIVTELRSRIFQIDTFLMALDQRTPQVAIQARIVFVDRTELEQLGLKYDLSTPTQFYPDLIPRGGTVAGDPPTVNLGGNSVAAVANASTTAFSVPNAALRLVYTTVLGNFTLTSFLEALQSLSLSDIQAEPSVTVADNRPATIFSGEDTPFRQVDAGSPTGGGATAARATTGFKTTGIRLDVTPHVVAGTREILMTLHAERSNVAFSPLSETGTIFNNQYATTQLLVRDGETAVIGGLSVTDIQMRKAGIPFLVDLPVIGALFGFRSTQEARRDLLILVTPHIVDDLNTAGAGGQIR